MNALDWLVLLSTMLGIVAYGIWRTRGKRDLNHYLKGDGNTRWFVIGLSVMATQASAVTFLSTPGQGYQDGMTFVQNYFGAPLALIVISIIFLPIYRKLNVYTAYEFLGKRFDEKTRLLGAILFLVQRGIGAGITVYAPAIVLSSVFHWRLDLTILLSGMTVIVYTVVGGSQAVTLTQKYQFAVIMIGMVTAFFILLAKLPPGLTLGDSLSLAGGFDKLNSVDFSLDYKKRYTLWSGLLGGMFLALSYFGTDQTQVQRYIGAASLRESRLGLMFNAVFKIPMQFFILLLGVMLFVFYQFEKPPVFFNQTEWNAAKQLATPASGRMDSIERDFDQLYAARRQNVIDWLDARHRGDEQEILRKHADVHAANQQIDAARKLAKDTLAAANPRAKTNDADYVFITFILGYLPHGLIGLLVAVFFAATLSSKAGELNALASTSIVDIYKRWLRPDATDRHYVIASKAFTVFWGVAAIGFALSMSMAENLIQYGNIVASLFYGAILGLFLIGFFLNWIGGTAAFTGAALAEILVLVLYWTTPIGYLWYNVIGPAACVALSVLLQLAIGRDVPQRGFAVIPANDA